MGNFPYGTVSARSLTIMQIDQLSFALPDNDAGKYFNFAEAAI